MKKAELKNIANFLFEAGILAKTPRSGLHFLGTGSQSVAEHANRVTITGYAMAMLDGKVDVAKVMKMCLLHDLAEGRTSDLNYVHQKYVTVDEDRAISDLTNTLPFGADMQAVLKEYLERKTRESLIAKDADNIEWILALKDQADLGNDRALSWIPPAVKRLKTEVGQKIAAVITSTKSDEWWYSEKEQKSKWWVDRNGKTHKK